MAAVTAAKKGAKKSQKGRKVGRQIGKPTHARYNGCRRDLLNAAKRAKRHAKRLARIARRQAILAARGEVNAYRRARNERPHGKAPAHRRRLDLAPRSSLRYTGPAERHTGPSRTKEA